MSIFIPERFKQAVDNHLIGNLLALDGYPLMLSIFGEPGVGKTFQLRTHLEDRGFNVHSVNAADLESDRAGDPARLLRKVYIDAGEEMDQGKGSAIVIDDIDTTMGEWENNTGTVNHQDLIAFFMHIADSPTEVEGIGCPLRRVPIFLTGNDFDKLYKPLRRPGRMNLFRYAPTPEEKEGILRTMFGDEHAAAIRSCMSLHPDEPISYFSGIRASAIAEAHAQFSRGLNYALLVSSETYRAAKKQELEEAVNEIDWSGLLSDGQCESQDDEEDGQCQ